MNQTFEYPLSKNHPEKLTTATGKKYQDITVEAVMNGEITKEDISITPQALELQATIAEKNNKLQLAQNLRRAAELTKIPDHIVLDIYNMLRPNRSTKQQLLALSQELREKYQAFQTAELIREAAEIYDKRGICK